jgi:hypothetical protein
VTGLTRAGTTDYFHCDIKGLGAESVKLIEDFRRTGSWLGEFVSVTPTHGR